MKTGTTKIPHHCQPIKVHSLEQASREYCRIRDESGEGASTFGTGFLYFDDRFYRISYNGKVWEGMELRNDSKLAFDPYAAANRVA